MRYDFPVVQIVKPDLFFNRASLELVPLTRYKVILYGDCVYILPDKHGSLLRWNGNRTAELYAGAALRKIGERDKTHHRLYKYKDGFAFRLSEEIKEG